jgi:monovalent cation:proton antiporter-2 (CPA2) family protein
LQQIFTQRQKDPLGWLKKISLKMRISFIGLFACFAVGLGGSQRALAMKDSPTLGAVTTTTKLNAQSVLNGVTGKAGKRSVQLDFVVADASHGSSRHSLTHDSSKHSGSGDKDVSAQKLSRLSGGKRRVVVKKAPATVEEEVVEEVQLSWRTLSESLQGAKLDTLIMLLVTSSVIPIFKRLNASPILGFLLTGTLLGPSCLGWVHDVHTIDVLGELGIVFFLFEMGLELSIAKLKSMRKDVFGLGTSQFLTTAAAGAAASLAFGATVPAAVTIGGSLALSSSAFVLQLLKDKDEMGTRHGKASFGILLLQDLAVVPLLVVVELLSKGGTGMGRALTVAGVKAVVCVSAMGAVGKWLLDPIFYFVAKSSSQEAFLSIIMTTVLLMSFVTKGIGLSDTLGAFLAGLLLSETRYKYQIEADIAPFRGLLLGFFFMTVGFNIDIAMIIKEAPTIGAMLFSLLAGKAAIITALSMAFGISLANAQHCGLLTSQGGEFAFVALGTAARAGLINPKLSKLLMTTVALSMAATPALEGLGSKISKRIEQKMGELVDLRSKQLIVKLRASSWRDVACRHYGCINSFYFDAIRCHNHVTFYYHYHS